MIIYSVDLRREKSLPKAVISGSIDITIAEIGLLVNLIYAGMRDRHGESADAFKYAFCDYITACNSPVWDIHGDTSAIKGMVIAPPQPEGGEDDG